MNNIVDLINLENFHCCKLNILTGEKVFCQRTEKKTKGFTGLYFMDERIFFAIYPTENGPIMYYEGNEYALNKELHITLRKNGKNRTFRIDEYNIRIDYFESPFIGMDVWSDEEDVDLFYQIAKFYRDDEYYKDYFI